LLGDFRNGTQADHRGLMHGRIMLQWKDKG